MAQLIIECIDKISLPEIEKELQCNEEKEQFCIREIPDQQNYEKNELKEMNKKMEKKTKQQTFKNYLRRENIGNQYLLVAKPRHEEDISSETENPIMTAVKGLTNQVQEQMITLKKRLDVDVNTQMN